MLYPKNNTPKLSPELFKNPTSEYRCTPFWAWNCDLDEDELYRFMQGGAFECPYFNPFDEYKVVRKQN